MKPREIRPGVYWVGAIDWDRRLFDALIPLPDGTSYNSYLVRGSEKAALIDTVDPTMGEVLVNHLEHLEIKNVDYVVANHASRTIRVPSPESLRSILRQKSFAHPGARGCLSTCC